MTSLLATLLCQSRLPQPGHTHLCLGGPLNDGYVVVLVFWCLTVWCRVCRATLRRRKFCRIGANSRAKADAGEPPGAEARLGGCAIEGRRRGPKVLHLRLWIVANSTHLEGPSTLSQIEVRMVA